MVIYPSSDRAKRFTLNAPVTVGGPRGR